MSTSDNYAQRRDQFKPRTVQELRKSAQQMLRDGLGEHTVAAALQLDVNAVRRLIGECVDCGL